MIGKIFEGKGLQKHKQIRVRMCFLQGTDVQKCRFLDKNTCSQHKNRYLFYDYVGGLSHDLPHFTIVVTHYHDVSNGIKNRILT